MPCVLQRRNHNTYKKRKQSFVWCVGVGGGNVKAEQVISQHEEYFFSQFIQFISQLTWGVGEHAFPRAERETEAHNV